VLGRQAQAPGEADEGDPPPGRLADIAVERVNGGEVEAADAHVGGDISAVGQNAGLEDKQCEREQTGGGREHLLRGQEDEQAEDDDEDGGGHARAEQQRAGRVVAAVRGAVAVQQFAAAVVGLEFEVAPLRGRDLQVQRQKGQRRDHLRERRMLRVEAEVPVFEGHVAGEEMIAFVPAGGLPADAADDLKQQKAEQRRGCEVGPARLQRGCAQMHGGNRTAAPELFAAMRRRDGKTARSVRPLRPIDAMCRTGPGTGSTRTFAYPVWMDAAAVGRCANPLRGERLLTRILAAFGGEV
jgi:hypothetical protein